jgi:hypothetical protein
MCRTNPILLKRFNLAPQVDALRAQRFERPPVASGVPTIAPVLASIDVSSLVSERNLLRRSINPCIFQIHLSRGCCSLLLVFEACA